MTKKSLVKPKNQKIFISDFIPIERTLWIVNIKAAKNGLHVTSKAHTREAAMILLIELIKVINTTNAHYTISGEITQESYPKRREIALYGLLISFLCVNFLKKTSQFKKS